MDIFVIKSTCMDPLLVQHTWGTAFKGLSTAFFSTNIFFFLWSTLHSIKFFLSFFLLLLLHFFFFITDPINGATAGDSGDRCRSDLSFFLFSSFSPFSSQTHKKKKKKSTIRATNWLLWVCEFSGCFKDANEFCGFVLQAQNRSGCCGYWGLKGKKKKKERKKRECLGWSLWFWEEMVWWNGVRRVG